MITRRQAQELNNAAGNMVASIDRYVRSNLGLFNLTYLPIDMSSFPMRERELIGSIRAERTRIANILLTLIK